VNEDPSPALDVPGPTLETIHRQAADNPILELATKIRTGADGRFGSTFEDGKGVAVTRNREEFLDSILRAFDADAFAEDATHAATTARSAPNGTGPTRIGSWRGSGWSAPKPGTTMACSG
jgi:exodeoxyribonuclease-5